MLQPETFKLFAVTKGTRQLPIQPGLDPNFRSQLFVLNCISSPLLLCLVVEASILRANRGGSSPLQHGAEKSLQSFMQEEGEGDGPHSCLTLPF